MRVLILGGTRFLGRHLVGAALAREHEVTLFNRGRTAPGLFPGVEELRGDRGGAGGGDLAALRGRRWEAVIDTSGYLPRDVRAPAGLLAGNVEHYTFVSSISVYADFRAVGADEGAPLRVPPEPEPEEPDMDLYGESKVGCERAAEAAMPGRTLMVRPGLIVGPHDYTHRFSYWCRRVAEGGEVLAPGDPERQVQLVDARDLAAWMVRMAERRSTGVFNATGPEYRLPMKEMLETVRAASGSDARFTWVSERHLLDAGIEPWTEMPLWLPQEMAGMLAVDAGKAVRAGLVFRPLADTVRDTLAREKMVGTREANGESSGLSRGRARAVLWAWREREHA